jgi:hypothetical protein
MRSKYHLIWNDVYCAKTVQATLYQFSFSTNKKTVIRSMYNNK